MDKPANAIIPHIVVKNGAKAIDFYKAGLGPWS